MNNIIETKGGSVFIEVTEYDHENKGYKVKYQFLSGYFDGNGNKIGLDELRKEITEKHKADALAIINILGQRILREVERTPIIEAPETKIPEPDPKSTDKGAGQGKKGGGDSGEKV